VRVDLGGALVAQAAERLTPLQWQVVGQVGLPSWCEGGALWEPLTRGERLAALGLCRLGLLDQEGVGAYRLTPLGERVAGLRLLDAVGRRW
jgi:hypothetical protein